MSSILKGNFETKKQVKVEESAEPETNEARFEREAMKRLGGSIAFVSKKKVMWEAEPKKAPAPAKPEKKPEES